MRREEEVAFEPARIARVPERALVAHKLAHGLEQVHAPKQDRGGALWRREQVGEHVRELRAAEHAPRALLGEVVDAAVHATGTDLGPYRAVAGRMPHVADPLVLGTQPPSSIRVF